MNYQYYFPEDGECSLNNPIVWKRLCVYIRRTIRFTKWIKNKHFIEANEVLISIAEQLKGIDPATYGSKEMEDAITFLIKKINKQIGREWWKYLKVELPEFFDEMRMTQKIIIKQNREIGKYKYPKTVKKNQQQYRDDVSDGYILGCVYNNLKNTSGIRYSFDEIRQQFPHLIEQKKETILKKRAKKKSDVL